MSEQTPDANNGVSDGQDPSMEDILASIRKIIAEDDAPAAIADEPIDMATAEPLKGDVSELAQADYLDLDIIEDNKVAAQGIDTLGSVPEITSDPISDLTNIDTLIGDMDAGSSDDLVMPEIAVEASTEDRLEDILDLEIPMEEPDLTEPLNVIAAETTQQVEIESLVVEDDLALDDEMLDLVSDFDDEIIEDKAEASSGLMGGAMAALGLGGAAIAAKTASSDDIQPPEEDDLSLMLDNMLEDSSTYEAEPAAHEQFIDPAEDLLDELELTEEMPAVTSEIQTQAETDPDIDLVKSLMADLTEEPLHEEGHEEDAITSEDVEVEGDIDTLLSDIDIDDGDDSSDDLMDEILSMTLDDETKLSEEIAIPELNVVLAEDVPIENLSLKEIAAAAEADADASDGGLPTGVLAGLGAAALGGAAVAASQTDDVEPEASAPDDVDTALSQLDDLLGDDTLTAEDQLPEEPVHITPEPITEETPTMARAKKTEAIIDEVTEEATAGAFASLTNVVENKAVTAERGDRIGDLVMEALQPMLKEWLDANLKGIVERAVTKEVKRISSGK